MESPIEVVRRFCAAWSDDMGTVELAAFFTEDAVYHNIPQEPVTGRENIATTIASVLRPGPPGIESIDFRVINIAANGPVVMTERVDVFTLPGKSFELPVMGTFEVSGGKINAWRDYIYQTDEVAVWLRELQASDPKTADLVDDAIYTLSRSGPALGRPARRHHY